MKYALCMISDVHVYICFVCISSDIQLCTCMCVYIHLYMHMYLCMHVHVYMYISLYINVHNFAASLPPPSPLPHILEQECVLHSATTLRYKPASQTTRGSSTNSPCLDPVQNQLLKHPITPLGWLQQAQLVGPLATCLF